jgi:hypothetical protein
MPTGGPPYDPFVLGKRSTPILLALLASCACLEAGRRAAVLRQPTPPKQPLRLRRPGGYGGRAPKLQRRRADPAAEGTARRPAGPLEKCELVRLEGVPVLRLSGGPRERGYAHGYFLAQEIVDVFRQFRPLVVSAEDYERKVRPQVRDRFRFPEVVREELEGMLEGIRARFARDALFDPGLGREIDRLDLLAMQAMPDWYPFHCSAFVVWGSLAPEGPVTGRNLDFAIHPVLLRNHLLVYHARSGEGRAWISLTWPGLVGGLSAWNEAGVAAFLLDADAPRVDVDEAGEGFLPRAMAVRRIMREVGPEGPAEQALEMLKDVPTRWGGNVFVAGPRGADAGVLERDAAGTSLRLAASDPVARGVPAFACTNHFRLRAEPVACERYEAITRRFVEMSHEGGATDARSAFDLLHDVRQPGLTMQSMVLRPRTKEVSLRLVRPEDLVLPRSKIVRLTWDEIVGRPKATADERRRKGGGHPPMHADGRR